MTVSGLTKDSSRPKHGTKPSEQSIFSSLLRPFLPILLSAPEHLGTILADASEPAVLGQPDTKGRGVCLKTFRSPRPLVLDRFCAVMQTVHQFSRTCFVAVNPAHAIYTLCSKTNLSLAPHFHPNLPLHLIVLNSASQRSAVR
jgi:hypothetical protein